MIWACVGILVLLGRVEKIITYQNSHERVEIREVAPIYYNNVKVNGDCALVDPPCHEDFERNVIRLK